MMTVKKGDKVTTKHGHGIIVGVDTETYSIVMYTIKLTTSRYASELLIVCESEFIVKGHDYGTV